MLCAAGHPVSLAPGGSHLKLGNSARNPKLFHATFSLLNKRDRITFSSNFYIQCILLFLSYKKLCVWILTWG